MIKGIGFDSWRRVGPILPAIKVYNIREVDELIIVDITATEEEREPDYEEIAEFTLESFIPMTVGGGVTGLNHFKKLLRAGADKVTVNSAAYHNPDLISQAANRFGSQCVVASIDFQISGTEARCASRSGQKAHDISPVTWAKELEELGAGEILLTSVERDGTMDGYNLEVTKAVSEAVQIPVIASGGCGSYHDMHSALTEGKASAVAAASIYHFTELTPLGAKEYLQTEGEPVRIPPRML